MVGGKATSSHATMDQPDDRKWVIPFAHRSTRAPVYRTHLHLIAISQHTILKNSIFFENS